VERTLNDNDADRTGLSTYAGKQICHVDFEICRAIHQIRQYTTGKPAADNWLILLNLVFLPNDTKGNHDDNSGIKYVAMDKKGKVPRIERDSELFQKHDGMDQANKSIRI
jgi:hypothetical protein